MNNYNHTVLFLKFLSCIASKRIFMCGEKKRHDFLCRPQKSKSKRRTLL